MSAIRNKAVEGLKIGDTFTLTRTFSERDMVHFADISRDYNPVHFDDRYAAVKNFRSRICHGLLVASMLTEIGGQIGWLATGMQMSFRKPVYFDDTIRCRFTIQEIDANNWAKARARFKNQHGTTVLEALLTGILPGTAERDILKNLEG